MNERKRPYRRGRGPRTRQSSETNGEPNPYADGPSDGESANASPPAASSAPPSLPIPDYDRPAPRPPIENERPTYSRPFNDDRPPRPLSYGVPYGSEAAANPPAERAPRNDRGERPDRSPRPDRNEPRNDSRGDRNDRNDRSGAGDRNAMRKNGRRGRSRFRRPDDVEVAAGPPVERTPPTPVVAEDTTTGWVDVAREGGFVRLARNSYLPDPADPFLPPALVRQYSLRRGDKVDAAFGRDQRGRSVVTEITALNDGPPVITEKRPEFNSLTASYPDRKLTLETGRPAKTGPELTRRAIDLIAPIGYGQRALIVAPARAGKTTLLQAIVEGVAINHPQACLLILLVDERPEEVSEMVQWGYGEVVASSFDMPAKRHVEVAEMVQERARRMVEQGKDVVIVLDSITRLARAFNTNERGTGRTMSGGLDSNAMQKPKAFFRVGTHDCGSAWRWITHHYFHCACRNWFAHGRHHFRRIQRHRQLRNQARSQPGRPSHLPGIRYRGEWHASRRKTVSPRSTREGVSAASRASPVAPASGHGVADQAHCRYAKQRFAVGRSVSRAGRAHESPAACASP